jgi:hypothetical protein
MRYVLAMITCLAALSLSGCALESQPEPPMEESSSQASFPPFDQDAGVVDGCKGRLVCSQHILFCFPDPPASQVVRLGPC